jgi:hypothetical protein
MKVGDVTSQHADTDLPGFRDVANSILKVGQQAGNVFRVRLHRQRRRVFLDLQVAQKPVDCLFHERSLRLKKDRHSRLEQTQRSSGISTTGQPHDCRNCAAIVPASEISRRKNASRSSYREPPAGVLVF